MFVSSYSTYINPVAPNKTTRTKEESSQEKFGFSSTKPTVDEGLFAPLKPQMPVDYIAKSRAFYNKLLLQNQSAKKETRESINFSLKNYTKQLSAQNTIEKVSLVYAKNVKMFPIMKKPSITLDQTPKIDKSLPPQLQNIQEKHIRNIMINTYLENDKYYAISA